MNAQTSNMNKSKWKKHLEEILMETWHENWINWQRNLQSPQNPQSSFLYGFWNLQVMDLIPVLRMLEKQNPTDSETWETRYVLLIWLSIISKIPFPLSRLEISDTVEPSQTIIVRCVWLLFAHLHRRPIFWSLKMSWLNFRLLEICKLYCMSKDACSVAAVFLIANFITRSDVKKLYLEEMIMWCLKVNHFLHLILVTSISAKPCE